MSIDTATPPRATRGGVQTAAVWVGSVLLALVYVMSGLMKFLNPDMATKLANHGYPDWFRVLIGVVELGGALALLVPRTAFYAAGALGIVMVGAVFTHLLHGEAQEAVVPFVLLCVLTLVGYARRPWRRA